MARSDNFYDSFPTGGRLPKNLRLNAREFGEYLYNQEVENEGAGDHAITNRKFGRGAIGESST